MSQNDQQMLKTFKMCVTIMRHYTIMGSYHQTNFPPSHTFRLAKKNFKIFSTANIFETPQEKVGMVNNSIHRKIYLHSMVIYHCGTIFTFSRSSQIDF